MKATPITSALKRKYSPLKERRKHSAERKQENAS